MKRVLTVATMAMFLGLAGCSSMGHKKSCGCGEKKEAAHHHCHCGDGCKKDGQCGMKSEKPSDSK